jgi:hypothetical protein
MQRRSCCSRRQLQMLRHSMHISCARMLHLLRARALLCCVAGRCAACATCRGMHWAAGSLLPISACIQGA